MISESDIMKNAETYQEQVFKILDKSKTEVVYNSVWLNKLGITGLLNLCGKYTVSRMLERDDFSKRYASNTPITIVEFIYPLLQGYDSVAVNADIELGGNDQKFNLLVGRELQRDFGQEPQVVMTMPLLVGTDGQKKMSKSYKNYVGVTDQPADMYGKLMSIPDNLMHMYYELLTREDLDKTDDKIKSEPRNAKAVLAQLITEQYHGKQAADTALAEFDKIFSKKSLPETIPEHKTGQIGWDSVSQLLVQVSAAVDTDNQKLSRKEVKRLIEQNAVELSIDAGKEFTPVKEDNKLVLTSDVIFKVGKRRFYKIVKT
jgi:tyrosyl-tRNA synthetase